MPKAGEVQFGRVAPPKNPLPKSVAITPDNPRPIPRLFENLIHIEQALDHLNKVGIFFAPNAAALKEHRNKIISDLQSLCLKYQTEWNRIS